MKLHKLLCAALVLSMITAAGCTAATTSSEKAETAGGSTGHSTEAAPAADSGVKSVDGFAGEAADKGKSEGEPSAAVRSDSDIVMNKSIEMAGEAVDGADAYGGDYDIAGEAAPEIAMGTADGFTGDYPDVVAPAEPGTEPEIVDDEPDYEPPEAGQLTAAEWRDNENWGFFTNLVTSGTIEFPSFTLDPRGRIMITVKDESGNPSANVKAELYDDGGKLLWSAVTDKTGAAYLFAGDGEPKNVKLEANGKTQEFPVEYKSVDVKAFDDTVEQDERQQSGEVVGRVGTTEMELTFSGNKAYKNTEIMFIVDTTGSMSDEMMFLQSEFSAIAKQAGTQNTKYSVNFYRDEGDDYVTKCNDFTDDISKIQKLLNNERADGGGDFPEAVTEILDETLANGKWSEESVKLAFLIFDAPPHEENLEVLNNAIVQAAKKGIRVIPVISSDSDRDTELFGRAVAIMTGGSYVFLTDDSGIGNSHLEPIVGDYEVEKLYDIIVRLIEEYRQ